VNFNGLAPWLKPAADFLLSQIVAAGLRPEVTSVYRSYSTQAKLYADYLAGRRTLPAARPGTSKHQLGLAFDMVIRPYPQYQAAAGAVWQRMGGKWFASDPVHFEA
jgi:LAS superfamily LD-carboxypeptidase LdcB